MNFYAISGLIISVGFFALAAAVYFKGQRTKIQNIFTLFASSVGIYAFFGVVLGGSSKDPDSVLLLWRLSYLFGVLWIPIFFYHFVHLLCELKNRFAVPLFYITGFLWLPFLFTKYIFSSTYFVFSSFYYARGGSLFFLIFTWWWSIIAYSFYHLIKTYISLKPFDNKKDQIKYTILGTGSGYLGGLPLFLMVFGIPIYPYAQFLLVLCVGVLIYALLKYQWIDIRIILKKLATYVLIIICLSVIILVTGFFDQFFVTSSSSGYFMFPRGLTYFVGGFIIFLIGLFFWKKSEKTARMQSEFLAIIAHEIRTPLTHIKLATENLVPKTPEDKALIDKIDMANKRLIVIANEFVQAARDSEDSYFSGFKPTSLESIVTAVLEEIKDSAREKGVSIHTDISHDLPLVKADENKIKSVVSLILTNALNYGYEGGKVDIALKKEGNNILFSVQDYGAGISKEDLPYIFMKFFRGERARSVDTSGSGIALSFAQDIIERHEGRIGVYSEGVDKGARFWFSLPIV